MCICMYIYIYIYIPPQAVHAGAEVDPHLLEVALHGRPGDDLVPVELKDEAVVPTRQRFIHHRQYMLTVSNETNVYCILSNWCICINTSCGVPLLAVHGVAEGGVACYQYYQY